MATWCSIYEGIMRSARSLDGSARQQHRYGQSATLVIMHIAVGWRRHQLLYLLTAEINDVTDFDIDFI
jgi:hypothetical protein